MEQAEGTARGVLRSHLMFPKGPGFLLAVTCTITSHGSSLPSSSLLTSHQPLPLKEMLRESPLPGRLVLTGCSLEIM